MQKRFEKNQLARSAEAAMNSASVTSAIGMGESAGRLRARRSSLFTQTVIWITALICMAFLIGSLAQAWSNSQSAQQVQGALQQLQQLQSQNKDLTKASNHYKDAAVIEGEARQQLGYSRPGEHVIVVVGSNQSNTTTTKPHVSPPAQHGFWQDWWNAFFGG
jgi:cell division protein FtsB